MRIYECSFTLMEEVFFSSREINNLYEMEPIIGHYALTYALGFVKSKYNQCDVKYIDDLKKLNEEGIYVTPGLIRGKPRFTFNTFNAIPDEYHYAMKQINTNYPQMGMIKALSINNQGVFYVISKIELSIPLYMRLGKFMGKVKIEPKELQYDTVKNAEEKCACAFGINDYNEDLVFKNYDIVNIHPVPILKNIRACGDFYRLENGQYIIKGLKYGGLE